MPDEAIDVTPNASVAAGPHHHGKEQKQCYSSMRHIDQAHAAVSDS